MLHIVLSFESLSSIDRLLALEVAVKVKLNVDYKWIFGLVICWTIWACIKSLFYGDMLVKFDGLRMIKRLSWD